MGVGARCAVVAAGQPAPTDGALLFAQVSTRSASLLEMIVLDRTRCFGKLEKSRVLCQGSPSWWWASCAVVSLVEGSVCVASAFSIATGKLVGDCDLVPSTSASFTPALEAEIRGARQA